MYKHLYKIYPKVFGDNYKVLYMDTDSIYAKLYMKHDKYLEILEENKDFFGNNLGQIQPEPEILDIPIQEGVFHHQKVIVMFAKVIYLIIKTK